MRHKWKKLKGKHHLIHDENTHYVASVKECIHCGLLKGNVKSLSYYGNVVYYKDEKLLSLDTLPFPCIDSNADLFLTKEDFEDWDV